MGRQGTARRPLPVGPDQHAVGESLQRQPVQPVATGGDLQGAALAPGIRLREGGAERHTGALDRHAAAGERWQVPAECDRLAGERRREADRVRTRVVVRDLDPLAQRDPVRPRVRDQLLETRDLAVGDVGDRRHRDLGRRSPRRRRHEEHQKERYRFRGESIALLPGLVKHFIASRIRTGRSGRRARACRGSGRASARQAHPSGRRRTRRRSSPPAVGGRRQVPFSPLA